MTQNSSDNELEQSTIILQPFSHILIAKIKKNYVFCKKLQELEENSLGPQDRSNGRRHFINLCMKMLI